MSYLSNREYGLLSHKRLLVKLKNSSSITKRLNLDYKLNVHRGCVNTICWNDTGTTILSGSDDQNLIVTDPYTRKVLTKVHSGHRENIFSAKFLPETNDRRVVSCSGDGVLFHTNFDRPPSTHSNEGCFTCHGSATAYEVRIIPRTPNLFLSCSDDCTIRLYDLRTKNNCLKNHCHEDILIKSHWPVTSMDINPMNPNEIVCACSDGSIRLYDHRKLSTQTSSTQRCEESINGLLSYFLSPNRKKEHARSRITSVVFNQHGTEVLASYSSGPLYLLDPKQTLSQEQMKDYLVQHQNEKRSRSNTVKENKSTRNNQSHVNRLRLRGDWSDTGPDSRPSNEEESEPSPPPPTNQSESTTTTTNTSGQGSQNFFMQRMTDILTQLVPRPSSDTEQTESTTTSNETSTNNTTARRNPTTQTPSSPQTSQNTASTANNNEDDDDDDPETERMGIFDLIFGGNPGFRAGDDDDDDDVGSMEDDEDSSAAPSNPHVSASQRRASASTKWERMRKRREAERLQEQTLMKNIPSLGLLNSYDGHRNARTMIKEANFWSDSYVMSGSDCGNIFIWNKFTGNIIRIIEADKHVVNCVQPHPLNYPILAASGIDYDIKIFAPLAEFPIDDTERIDSIVKRNQDMMDETSSTITVPASFIFRMLTSIYHLRHSEDMSGMDDDD